MPTINELYRTFVVGNVTTQANAALVNERLVGFEGGLDYKPTANIDLSITGFDNKLKHAIANVTTGVNVNQRQNVDAIHATGVEFSAAVHFGQVSLDGSLAWTDARVEASGTSLDGRRPAQTPKVSASGTLAWKPREHWLAALTLRHVGAQFEDDLGTSVLPAATTLNAYVELPLAGPFSLVLRGENLTDTQVQTRNQAGSIDLGPPRTVWAGIKVRVGQ